MYIWAEKSLSTDVPRLNIKEMNMLIFFGQTTNDAMLCRLNEVGDIIYLRTFWNLVFDLEHCILYRKVAHIDKTVCISNVSHCATVCAGALQDCLVHTVVASRVSTEHDVWGHVLLHAASAFYERVTAHAHIDL